MKTQQERNEKKLISEELARITANKLVKKFEGVIVNYNTMATMCHATAIECAGKIVEVAMQLDRDNLKHWELVDDELNELT